MSGWGAGGGTHPPPPPVPPQSHWHGSHDDPGAQAGQAQAHPPPLGARWHTPLVQGWPTWHGTPKLTQMHTATEAALHEVLSVCAAHGSAEPPSSAQLQGQAPPSMVAQAGHMQVEAPLGAGLVLPPPPEPVAVPPVAVPPAAAQPQSHGAQGAPVAQGEQAQAQVPLLTQPPPLPPPGLQSQAHGGQVAPAAHAGQTQVQLPPPVPPLPPEQSHSTGGQAALDGQYSGVAQAQPPPTPVEL